MKKRDKKKYQLLKDLVEGHSKQSSTSNKFWLVLITISIIGITSEPDGSQLVELPFKLGKVNLFYFNFILIILISSLIIAFSSAMIQVIRTRLLIQKIIEKYSKKINFGIHIQDLVDSLLLPTYNRVAPISKIILGDNQFLRKEKSDKNSNKTISDLLYKILKIFSYFIIYFIPVITIYKSWSIIYSTRITIWFIIPIIGTHLAILSIIILFCEDIKYMFRALSKNEDYKNKLTKFYKILVYFTLFSIILVFIVLFCLFNHNLLKANI